MRALTTSCSLRSSTIGPAGLLRESDGRLRVPARIGRPNGEPLPLIVRKSDGGTLPATDLARSGPDRHAGRDPLLYVSGCRSAVTSRWCKRRRAAGWLAPPVRAEHVGFGDPRADGDLRSRPAAR